MTFTVRNDSKVFSSQKTIPFRKALYPSLTGIVKNDNPKNRIPDCTRMRFACGNGRMPFHHAAFVQFKINSHFKNHSYHSIYRNYATYLYI